ncbi:hypothetical protein [Rhodocista pekingensis]|uniref:Uncharacterized protein n=1 Tax=Rhodocista pekingensis TaxID=201185 RepID=A0ABW2KSI3_9PROT
MMFKTYPVFGATAGAAGVDVDRPSGTARHGQADAHQGFPTSGGDNELLCVTGPGAQALR